MTTASGYAKREVVVSSRTERYDSLGVWSAPPVEEFCHQALVYEDDPALLGTVEEFVREGLDTGERSLVVMSGQKVDLLRDRMGADVAYVNFAYMDEVGTNPARILPMWRSFLESVGPGNKSRGASSTSPSVTRPASGSFVRTLLGRSTETSCGRLDAVTRLSPRGVTRLRAIFFPPGGPSCGFT